MIGIAILMGGAIIVVALLITYHIGWMNGLRNTVDAIRERDFEIARLTAENLTLKGKV